jgi:hemolysin activation/secretion protein
MWMTGVPLHLTAATAATNEPVNELQLQQERERVLRMEMEQQPDVRLPPAQAPEVAEEYPENEQPCLTISKINLTGDEAPHFAFALDSVTAGRESAIGRCLGTHGINKVMARVQNAIIARGYVTTRVLATPQDLKSGELRLSVIPGRVHAIRFAEDASPRGTWWNALPISPNDLLSLRDIEQGLENFKRLPTSDADIRIEPSTDTSAQPGDSDIIIHYRQTFPFRITLSTDDGGSHATGKYQGAVTLSGDNLLTLNDLFYYSANRDLGGGNAGARGTRGNTVHYSLPFGYWMLGMTASEYIYRQAVAGASQTYLYRGESGNAEVRLSRLIYRDAVRKTTVSLLAYLETSSNYIDDTEIAVQRRRMAGWQADLYHREFMGSATLDLDLAYRQGTGMLDALHAPEEAFNEGTARPRIVNAAATLNLPFALGRQHLRYNGNWRAQWNDTPLIPQDRFAIGGRYTVRGFDGESILSAERGWLMRNDLGWTAGNSGQELYLGLDYGQVSGPSAGLLIGRHLSGAVLGLRGGYQGLFWDMFVGGPLVKPDGFKPAHGTAGFNLSWTF